MTPIRSIIAATDFSQHASTACARAALVAAEHGAALELVHVLEQEGLTTLRDWLAPKRDYRAAIAEQAEMLLAATAKQVLDEQGISARPNLRSGRPLQELNAAAASADLLVLGDRGGHLLRAAAIGTTADRLLRTATRPLLVVKTAPTASYRRVLVLVDFSPASDAAVQAALRVAPRATIRLLHAVDLPFEGKLRIAGVGQQEIEDYRRQYRQRAMEQFRLLLARGETGDRVTIAVEEGDVRLQFVRAVEEWQPDLVAIGKQGQDLLSDLFLGSVTRIVLAEAPCDVLVVPAGALHPGEDAR
ncbi:MAG: bifunctional protein : transcriptional regulator, AraC family [Ramlibacter sp.]|nr:bifunctional protein : transcriptional regulator, AraC family [Ramlibacter sp.]MDB5913548.1 bifunctional protein : transcriptional regulator, AraC family [Ramlibacter sp.]